MKEMFRQIKIDLILSALLCVALGVVLLVWPDETIDIFCKILAGGIILMGVVQLVIYFRNRSIHPFAGVLGFLIVVVGIWIFLRPESLVSLIPIVIGVILCVHGIQDIKLAIETRANGYEHWWYILLIAAVSLVLGVLCIIHAFGVVKLAIQFIGVALIYDGISDLWIANRAIRAAKMMRQEAEALDVEYREVDDE